jgi:hypothetical protein
MADTVPSSSRTSTRLTLSCIRCAERKVKCDRQRPCSACIKHNADCVFNSSKPLQKKHKRIKVQVLSDRLKQYEALLQAHGIDRRDLPDNVNHGPSSQLNQTTAATTRLKEVHSDPHLSTEPDSDRNIEVINHENYQEKFKFVEK